MANEKQAFLETLDPHRHLDQLFNLSPDLYFFAKDLNSRFMICNKALLRKLGMQSEEEIIGRNDYDCFDRAIADKYREEDRQVFESGEAVTNRVWLVPNASGVMEWYLASKLPLFNRDGKVIGLAGLMSDHQQAGSLLDPYRHLAAVIDYITAHYSEQIPISQLASIANLSVSQFERTFRTLFRMTPLKYINQVRMDAAARALVRTDRTIADIALNCGYYDHSYFTKQFKNSAGMTPLKYRQTYHESQPMRPTPPT